MFKNDWLKYSFTDGFKLDFSPSVEIPLDNHLNALIENAQQIADSRTAPLELFFSGGINSQVILNVYKKLGIDVKVYIVAYTENFNSKDVSEAQRICNILNVPYTTIDFSLEKFFSTDAERIFHKWQGIDIKRLPLLKFPELANGNAILGHSEPYFYRKEIYYSDPSVWLIKFTEENFKFTHYLKNTGACAVPDWYFYDPSVIFSLLENPIFSMLVDDQYFGKISLVSTRGKIYKRYWAGFDDCAKRSGFENTGNYLLPEYMIDFHNTFIKDKIKPNNPITFELDEFRNKL